MDSRSSIAAMSNWDAAALCRLGMQAPHPAEKNQTMLKAAIMACLLYAHNDHPSLIYDSCDLQFFFCRSGEGLDANNWIYADTQENGQHFRFGINFRYLHRDALAYLWAQDIPRKELRGMDMPKEPDHSMNVQELWQKVLEIESRKKIINKSYNWLTQYTHEEIKREL